MKRILVPCDFSPPAQEAFRFAANIARQNPDSEIHVLYVIDSSIANNSDSSLSHSLAFDGSVAQKLEEQWNESFADMKRIFAPDLRSVTLKIEVGPLTPTIQDYIHNNNINLVA